MPARRHTPLQIFVCDEESHFYSQVLEKLLLRNCRDTRACIIEFGAGDGTPVINALLRGASAGCNFGDSIVHGYELNPRAAAVASRNAATMGVAHQYKASQLLPTRLCDLRVLPGGLLLGLQGARSQLGAALLGRGVRSAFDFVYCSLSTPGRLVLHKRACQLGAWLPQLGARWRRCWFFYCIDCDVRCLGRCTTAASSRGQQAQTPRGS